MKKSMIKKLVVLLVVMVVAGGFAFGADDALDLQGTVLKVSSIDISAEEVTFDIDPVSGLTDTDLATFTVVSNADYTVTATSSNGFKLNEAGGNESIAYDLYLDGSKTTKYKGGVTTGNTVNIGLSVGAASTTSPYKAGTYLDTVTLTIENK
jgi:spore coat protein U-like protein